jgi:hypothetical protein
MTISLSLKKEIVIAAFIFLITSVFSLVNFSSIAIKPNIFLVATLLAAFLIDNWYVYFVFILAQLFWLKFTPYFIFEYGVLFLIALLLFVLIRSFIFNRLMAVRFFLLFVFQLIFWLFLKSQNYVLSIVFLLELIYNIIVFELLYILFLWLKKTLF